MSKIILLFSIFFLLNAINSQSPSCTCSNSNCQVVPVKWLAAFSKFTLSIPITPLAPSTVIVETNICASCGYTIDYAENSTISNVLTYVSKTSPNAATTQTTGPQMVGGNSNYCFLFNVIKTGEANIAFQVYRPWEKLVSTSYSNVSITIIESTGNTNLISNSSSKMVKICYFIIPILGLLFIV